MTSKYRTISDFLKFHFGPDNLKSERGGRLNFRALKKRFGTHKAEYLSFKSASGVSSKIKPFW